MTNQLSNVCEEILQRLLVALAPVIEIFRQVYKNAGSPYGDSEEGFTLWLSELNDKSKNDHTPSPD